MKHFAQAFVIAALMCCGLPAMAADSLAQRVQRLEDQRAIEQLVVVDYANALDLMDMDAYANLFAEDGVLSLGGMERTGPEEIRKMFSRDPAAPPSANLPALPPGVLPMPPMEGPPRPRMVPHVITNPSYKITGDTAEGICYWMEIMLIEGRPGIVNMGHYEDRLKKVVGRWKSARRTIVRDVPIGTSVVPVAKAP